MKEAWQKIIQIVCFHLYIILENSNLLQWQKTGKFLRDHGAGGEEEAGNTKGLKRKSREGNGTPLQYFCLENPMDGGAWWAAVHGVAKSRTRLSDFTFTSHFHALEKEMATYSSVLAWRIPGTGSLVGCRLWGRRVGHN